MPSVRKFSRIASILTRLTGITLLFALQGCTGDAPKTTDAAKDGIITISVSTGPKEGEEILQKIWERRLEMFTAKYPNIRVNVSSWDYSPDSFIAKMSGGTAPDLVQTWATEGPIIMDQQLALDLTPLLESWEEYTAVRPIVLSPYQRDNEIFGFPISAYSMALFYNKALFRQAGIVDEEGRARPPATWEEFVEAAQKIQDVEQGRIGFVISGTNAFAGWHFLNWGWQAGGEFERKVNGRWTAAFDEPPVVRALGFLQNLRWKYNCIQKDFLMKPEDILRFFASGNAGMIIEPANDMSIIKLVERFKFDIHDLGIAVLPAGPGGRATQFGADYYIINSQVAQSRHDACFAWMKFSVSPEWIEARETIRAEFDQPAGAPYVPIFTGQSRQIRAEIMDRCRTVPPFEDYMNQVTESLRPEPPYFCQQLYSEALTPAVQEVLRNAKADPQKILQEKADRFEQRFLGRIR
jgi:multiple sugar transport system substrate-binding protein